MIFGAQSWWFFRRVRQGLGEVKNGEGVYGLRRALVLAGSESQVMSLWQVSDAATRDLMAAYYKRLQAGEGRTEALRQVQLMMIHSGAPGADGRRQKQEQAAGAGTTHQLQRQSPHRLQRQVQHQPSSVDWASRGTGRHYLKIVVIPSTGPASFNPVSGEAWMVDNNSRQKAEGRRQKARRQEGRRQTADGRRQTAEGRRQKAVGRWQCINP